MKAKYLPPRRQRKSAEIKLFELPHRYTKLVKDYLAVSPNTDSGSITPYMMTFNTEIVLLGDYGESEDLLTAEGRQEDAYFHGGDYVLSFR